MGWPEAQGLPELPCGLFQLSQPRQGAAQVVAGHGVERIELNRPAQVPDRLIQPSLLGKSHAEVAMSH